MSLSKGASILVIDDEVQIRRLLKISLESHGFKFFEAVNGNQGLIEAAYKKPDLIILDLNLPDMDGLMVLKSLREWNHSPVIVLSVMNSEEDKISLLDSGADDYLTKPFNTGELMARIRAALRHKNPIKNHDIFTSGQLKLDFIRRQIWVNDQEIKLTPTEYTILTLLAQNAGKVITHNQIIKHVWGKQEGVETGYIRVFINQLRKKLETDPTFKFIQTEPGVGYRLILY